MLASNYIDLLSSNLLWYSISYVLYDLLMQLKWFENKAIILSCKSHYSQEIHMRKSSA